MSDPNITMQRQIQALQDGHEQLRKADVPALYLPWSQRVLNPFPLASSGGVWGDTPLPWAVNVLAFYCTVYVATTNSGIAYWTLTLTSNPSAVAVASVNTSAIAADTLTRLSDITIAQPASTDGALYIVATATGSPGSIFIFPSLAMLRTGN